MDVIFAEWATPYIITQVGDPAKLEEKSSNAGKVILLPA